jgi:hypothetical protein
MDPDPAIFVIDPADPQHLELVKYSMVSLNLQATFLLVGCKRDLATEGHREVSVEEAQVRV